MLARIGILAALVFWAGISLATADDRPAREEWVVAAHGVSDSLDRIRASLVHRRRVFIAGSTRTDHPDRTDPTILAIDVRDGSVLWRDVVESEGGEDAFRVVTAKGGRVCVAGDLGNEAGGTNLIVRCYQVATGKLLVDREIEPTTAPEGTYHFSENASLTISGGMLIINAWENDPAPRANRQYVLGLDLRSR